MGGVAGVGAWGVWLGWEHGGCGWGGSMGGVAGMGAWGGVAGVGAWGVWLGPGGGGSMWGCGRAEVGLAWLPKGAVSMKCGD